MLLNTFIGCAVLLITNLALLYTSHLCVRRFLPNGSPSVRLVAIGLLYYSFIILIFQTLSPFYAITKTWVTISCLLIALLSHFIWGEHRNLKADIEPIRIWIRDGLNSRWAVLIIICGFVILLSLSRALLMPPLAWDCLTYHLTSAALWIKKGTLLTFNAPDQMSYNALFPINGELFVAWLLLPFHNDLLANTMNFPITLLGGISCYAIARELGMTRKEASFVSALIYFSPIVYVQITAEYTDNAILAFCSASVLFTIRFLRRACLADGVFALLAAGILLGTKYSGIPAAGLISIAIAIKIIPLVKHSGLFKKFSLILLGLIIVCSLGGRQYIINSIDARNPLYPFALEIFNHEIFEGSYYLEHVKEWISEYEENHGWNKFSLWEKEYRKFCYLNLTAGPKFLLFLVLALISIFTKPHHVSRGVWYFLGLMWIVPIIFFYTNASTDFARRAYWSDGSFRFLSPYIALFTIQALVILQKSSTYFKNIDFFLVALVAWDLLYINKNHIWEVEILYPLVVLILFLILTLFNLVLNNSQLLAKKNDDFLINSRLSSLSSVHTKQWAAYILIFTMLVGGLYFLQGYRIHTRHTYYRKHLDLHDFPRNFVNGWEFLDRLDEKKTIALTMDWKPPGHNWFFYPLLGRWLQNDVLYISAKYNGEVPTWLHMGKLRGKDFSIWFNNLKRKKVDYILIQTPWPIELNWMKIHPDKFKLVFSDSNCQVFKYTRDSA